MSATVLPSLTTCQTPLRVDDTSVTVDSDVTWMLCQQPLEQDIQKQVQHTAQQALLFVLRQMQIDGNTSPHYMFYADRYTSEYRQSYTAVTQWLYQHGFILHHYALHLPVEATNENTLATIGSTPMIFSIHAQCGGHLWGLAYWLQMTFAVNLWHVPMPPQLSESYMIYQRTRPVPVYNASIIPPPPLSQQTSALVSLPSVGTTCDVSASSCGTDVCRSAAMGPSCSGTHDKGNVSGSHQELAAFVRVQNISLDEVNAATMMCALAGNRPTMSHL